MEEKKKRFKRDKKFFSDKFSKSKQQAKEDLSFVVDEELFNATKEGDIEKVKSALENGVSPDARFGEDETPLLSIAAEVYID